MRGYVPNPTGLNTRKSDRGWLERQRAAQARMAGASFDGADSAWREKDEIRRAAYAEKARLDQLAVEQRKAENAKLRITCVICDQGTMDVPTAERCLRAIDHSTVNELARDRAIQERDLRTCPICDHGRVNAEMAVRIVDALEDLPSTSEPSTERLQILWGIATGDAYHGVHALRPTKGAQYPRRATASTFAPTVPAVDLREPAKAAPVATRKAAPPPPPWLDPDAVLED